MANSRVVAFLLGGLLVALAWGVPVMVKSERLEVRLGAVEQERLGALIQSAGGRAWACGNGQRGN